jgi:cell division protein FtsL
MDPQQQPIQTEGPDPYLQAQNVGGGYSNTRKIVFIFIAVIFAVGMVGAAMYYNYQNTQLKKQVSSLQGQVDELQTTNKNLEEAAQKVVAGTTQVAQTSQFYDIKEFGVRFKKSADLLEPIGVVNTSLGTSGFSSQGLMNAAFVADSKVNSTSSCSPNNSPLGGISRGKTGQTFQSTTFDKAQGAIKIGEFYYVLITPQSTCSQDTTAQAISTKQVAAFKTAFSTLEAIPSTTN